MHRYMVCKQIQPTKRKELSLPRNLQLPMHLCESEMTSGLTVLQFYDIRIDKSATLNLLQCMRVICGCRAVQINGVETSLALLAM